MEHVQVVAIIGTQRAIGLRQRDAALAQLCRVRDGVAVAREGGRVGSDVEKATLTLLVLSSLPPQPVSAAAAARTVQRASAGLHWIRIAVSLVGNCRRMLESESNGHNGL
jgi:hypothetical protein